jgi:plastocyanin
MRRKFMPIALCALLAAGCGGSGGGGPDPVDPGPGPGEPPTQTGTIAGSVNDIMGGAVAGATVRVSGPENRSAQSTSAGTFQMTSLPTGTYVVTVEPPAGYVVALGASEQEAATVTSGGTANVEFRLATAADADVLVVRLVGLSFSPVDASVPAGSRIRWVATETLGHTVTPDGHTEWAEYPLNNAGDVFEHRFDSAGNFPYYCVPHRCDGMTGTVSVTQ